MNKLLVSLMALSVLAIGTAAQAGPLSDALNKASSTVTKHENNMTQAKKDAEARKKAREAEIAKQQKAWQDKQNQAKKDAEARKKEWAKKQEQAKKNTEARKKANQKKLQEKKDAWNTLIGK